MKILVFGATGGSGRASIEHLLAQGHTVTAFVRPQSKLAPSERLRVVHGDVMQPDAVDRAMPGHDAVVVTLGISENPLRVRLLGPARTQLDVRSTGTRHVIAAMRKHGVKRLVVQTTYGVGDTRDKLGFADRLFFALLLRPQIADTEEQHAAVASSGLDWTLVQPVHLTDDARTARAHASFTGEIAQRRVSRSSVGRFLSEAVVDASLIGRSVALSEPVAG